MEYELLSVRKYLILYYVGAIYVGIHINAKDSVSEYLCPEFVQIIEVQMLLNMF